MVYGGGANSEDDSTQKVRNMMYNSDDSQQKVHEIMYQQGTNSEEDSSSQHKVRQMMYNGKDETVRQIMYGTINSEDITSQKVRPNGMMYPTHSSSSSSQAISPTFCQSPNYGAEFGATPQVSPHLTPTTSSGFASTSGGSLHQLMSSHDHLAQLVASQGGPLSHTPSPLPPHSPMGGISSPGNSPYPSLHSHHQLPTHLQ